MIDKSILLRNVNEMHQEVSSSMLKISLNFTVLNIDVFSWVFFSFPFSAYFPAGYCYNSLTQLVYFNQVSFVCCSTYPRIIYLEEKGL